MTTGYLKFCFLSEIIWIVRNKWTALLSNFRAQFQALKASKFPKVQGRFASSHIHLSNSHFTRETYYSIMLSFDWKTGMFFFSSLCFLTLDTCAFPSVNKISPNTIILQCLQPIDLEPPLLRNNVNYKILLCGLCKTKVHTSYNRQSLLPKLSRNLENF